MLWNIHRGLAQFTGIKELELDAPERGEEAKVGPESQMLGEATYEVASLYKPSWITPEMEAWGQLITVCGVIYAPRYIAYRERMKREAQAKTIEVRPVQSEQWENPTSTPTN